MHRLRPDHLAAAPSRNPMSASELFRALAPLSATLGHPQQPLQVDSLEEAAAAGVVLSRWLAWAEVQLGYIKQQMRDEARRRLTQASGAVVIPALGVGAARVFL